MSGLEHEVNYSVLLRFVTSDQIRYYYSKKTKKWMMTLTDIQMEHDQVTCHLNSSSPGKFWMSKAVNFHNIRVSNIPEFNNVSEPTWYIYN